MIMCYVHKQWKLCQSLNAILFLINTTSCIYPSLCALGSIPTSLYIPFFWKKYRSLFSFSRLAFLVAWTNSILHTSIVSVDQSMVFSTESSAPSTSNTMKSMWRTPTAAIMVFSEKHWISDSPLPLVSSFLFVANTPLPHPAILNFIDCGLRIVLKQALSATALRFLLNMSRKKSGCASMSTPVQLRFSSKNNVSDRSSPRYAPHSTKKPFRFRCSNSSTPGVHNFSGHPCHTGDRF